MSRLTFPVPPSAPEGTFAAGWNDRCAGLPFRTTVSNAWATGWCAADDVRDGERRPYNDTAPLASTRSLGVAA
jgi:hypothetical protein